MRVSLNIEANGLDPDKIWCIVCKDLDTGVYYEFRNLTSDEVARTSFLKLSSSFTEIIGHNIVGYDLAVLNKLIQFVPPVHCTITDTLIISKMVDYSRKGHSTAHYAEEFGISKPVQPPYHEFNEGLVTYCRLLTDIAEKIYAKYKRYINNSDNFSAINLEHLFQSIVNLLHVNGFSFNTTKAGRLLERVTKDLEGLDKDILDAFPPREVLIREFVPTLTKHGTISRSSIPRTLAGRLLEYEAGQTYRHTKQVPFNPASHKQLIEVLTEAGWKPIDKTQTHINKERELNALKRKSGGQPDIDAEVRSLYTDLCKLKKTGWKINENNLATLPATAPPASKLLAKRILLEARRRSLTEWLALVRTKTQRIHGEFYGIGAWTHRMAHQKPNTANIPNEFREDGSTKLLGKEMRSLWCAPKNRLLVGVDAEGIQLRIFAHYIDDKEFTEALVNGRKENKTDPHSLNQRVLGDVCRTRQAAKRFIYALVLGAGIGKLAEILGCSETEARDALERLMERYQGFTYLKEKVIPADAKRGWFKAIDGRPVRIPGDTEGSRKHLCMSGYLQNGEAIVVKKTTLKTLDKLKEERIDAILVNIVHDEIIIEIPNDVRLGEHVSDLFCRSIEEVGVELNLRCPLAGDGHVGLNWWEIH